MSQTSSPPLALKILLVENSKTARAVIVRLLESEGYNIQTVSTGAEALNALLLNDFDLLIMDVFMPELNGYEATQRIRATESNKSNIPIIAFTSSTNERDKRVCLEAGMNEYVIKSDTNEELLAILRKYQTKLGPSPSPSSESKHI